MFEMKRTVTYSQVGSNITMDMAGIVHYLQDCTLAHSESLGEVYRMWSRLKEPGFFQAGR